MPAHVNVPAVGERIRLVSMPDDPAPIQAGSIGIATRMRPQGGPPWQVEVDWEDSVNRLMLAIPPDTWELVCDPTRGIDL